MAARAPRAPPTQAQPQTMPSSVGRGRGTRQHRTVGGAVIGSMDTVGGAVIGSMDTGNMTSFGEERRREEVIALVVMEMTIGVVGIFINLMVVSSVRSEDCLQESTRTSVPQF